MACICHRQVLAAEGWQGKWEYTILKSLILCSVCKRLEWFMNIRDLAKSKTTHREQRLIARCTSRIYFATSAHIQDKLNFGGHVSVRTANTDGRSHDHLHWNICYWKRVHWSDKSRILLHPVDVRV